METFLVLLAWYVIGFLGSLLFAIYDTRRSQKLGENIGLYGSDIVAIAFFAIMGPIVPAFLWLYALFRAICAYFNLSDFISRRFM